MGVPVIGNCVTYDVAMQLMRAGAAGVMVGIGPGAARTSRGVLGVGIPQATAVSDWCRPGLITTGKRSLCAHIADGGIVTGGDICKCIACGAMPIGSPIARAKRPRSGFPLGNGHSKSGPAPRHEDQCGKHRSLERILRGPAKLDDGTHNLLGCSNIHGTLGARTIRDMQNVEVVVAPSLLTEGKVYQSLHLGMGK